MNTPLKDITNRKEMSAIDIFCNIILFFRNHMMKTVKKMNIGVEESDIKWVFTVPAMCSDEASQKIITKAAEMVCSIHNFVYVVVFQSYFYLQIFFRIFSKAGISREKVVLALESETALIYCSRQPLSNLEGADHVSVFEVGKKILLLDAGGISNSKDMFRYAIRINSFDYVYRKNVLMCYVHIIYIYILHGYNI